MIPYLPNKGGRCHLDSRERDWCLLRGVQTRDLRKLVSPKCSSWMKIQSVMWFFLYKIRRYWKRDFMEIPHKTHDLNPPFSHFTHSFYLNLRQTVRTHESISFISHKYCNYARIQATISASFREWAHKSMWWSLSKPWCAPFTQRKHICLCHTKKEVMKS